MNHRLVKIALMAAIAAVPSNLFFAGTSYQIVDLGTLGGSTSTASNIAGNGSVAGDAKNSQSVQHAVLWIGGAITDLGAPSGFIVSSAVAVNNAGQAAGYGEGNPQSYQAYRWMNGTWTPLGVLPGRSDSIAAGIDSAGRIAGTSFTLGAGDDRGFLWDSGTLTDLGTLGGATDSKAINDEGQITGLSRIVLAGGGSASRAFIWQQGVISELGVLSGETDARGLGINDFGDVAGSCWHIATTQLLAQNRATLWRDGGADIVDLGPTPGPDVCIVGYPFYTDNVAQAANNCGQVVGRAECIESGGPLAAFLWQDGVMSNLNDLVPGGSGWNLLSGTGINDAGQITGIGIAPNGELHAFLLNPDSPPACGLLALSVQGVGLSWKPAVGAIAYDVVRGDLVTLHATAGDYAAATTACVANDYPSTDLEDPVVPAPGEAFWILVRAVTAGGPGTYDDGAGLAVSRDRGIDASPSACP